MGTAVARGIRSDQSSTFQVNFNRKEFLLRRCLRVVPIRVNETEDFTLIVHINADGGTHELCSVQFAGKFFLEFLFQGRILFVNGNLDDLPLRVSLARGGRFSRGSASRIIQHGDQDIEHLVQINDFNGCGCRAS